MPAEQGPVGWDAERFATAVEQGTPPGSVADPELARDLEIAAMLSARGDAFAPRPDEKARARQQLMARLAVMDDTAPAPFVDDDTAVIPVVAPLVDDDPVGDADDTGGETLAGARVVPLGRPRPRRRHAMPSRPAGRARSRSAAGRVVRNVVLAGAAVLVVAAGGIFASRDALPGDFLYGVKRVAESAGLAMTFDDTAKARRQLDLATTRLDEVEQLAAREPGAADPELFQSTIKDFDTATGAGSRMLLSNDAASTADPVAGSGVDAAQLGDLRAWAGEQVARLSALRSALPAPAVPGADSSISLLDRLLGRAEALGDRSSCSQVTSGVVDDLGPLPAEGACSPTPAGSAGSGSTGGGTDPTTGTSQQGRNATDPGRAPATAGTPAPAAGEPGLTGAVPDPTTRSTAPTTTSPPSDVSIPVPLPLVPPIHLPPLLPGQPGITIG